MPRNIRITGASRATATRDLQDLVEKEALTRTGALKGTRYHLLSGRGLLCPFLEIGFEKRRRNPADAVASLDQQRRIRR